jgi:hypothetical protein
MEIDKIIRSNLYHFSLCQFINLALGSSRCLGHLLSLSATSILVASFALYLHHRCWPLKKNEKGRRRVSYLWSILNQTFSSMSSQLLVGPAPRFQDNQCARAPRMLVLRSSSEPSPYIHKLPRDCEELDITSERRRLLRVSERIFARLVPQGFKDHC